MYGLLAHAIGSAHPALPYNICNTVFLLLLAVYSNSNELGWRPGPEAKRKIDEESVQLINGFGCPRNPICSRLSASNMQIPAEEHKIRRPSKLNATARRAVLPKAFMIIY